MVLDKSRPELPAGTAEIHDAAILTAECVKSFRLRWANSSQVFVIRVRLTTKSTRMAHEYSRIVFANTIEPKEKHYKTIGNHIKFSQMVKNNRGITISEPGNKTMKSY